jgi:hypothetical protein
MDIQSAIYHTSAPLTEAVYYITLNADEAKELVDQLSTIICRADYKTNPVVGEIFNRLSAILHHREENT